MKENRTYYKKKAYIILLFITIILGFQSLYEYYKIKIDDPIQLLSAVLYGIIKLFLFAPPISPGDNTTIFYELAKWLAPILTSTFVFTKISTTLLHLKNIVFNKISGNHILVFENSFIGETLINNLLNEKNSYKISLISKKFIDDNLKSKYEKKGIATYQLDFENSDINEIKEVFSALNINNAKYMFFCSENDLENYAIYTNIIKRIKPKRHIGCYIKCESKTVSSYIEDMISLERKNEEKLKRIDTIHFDQTDLTVRMLMSDKCVMQSISSNIDKLSDIGERISVDIIDKHIRKMHILIIGINELTITLLKHISNDMTICLKDNTKVSIIDTDAATRMRELLYNNEGLKKSLDIEVMDLGFGKNAINEYLRNIKNDDDLSIIFLMNEDVVRSLKNLKLLDRYFESVPKLIRNISNVDLSYILPKNHEKIRIFGDVSQIMTGDVMIRESLDNRAKQFNESYNKASMAAGMGEGQKWNELSYVKKNSSRLSASHDRIKEEIVRKVFFSKTEEEIVDYLNKKFEEFSDLQNNRKENPEKFKQEFCKYLEEAPLLDFLSRLEHKRWCNSYYAMNFKYGEKKDENLKTHPCLIDDWDIIKGEKFEICHPEYDLLSVFTLFQKEE
ncbi:hypothetical protein HMPREF9970_0759 [Lachnoanaerobaculum saburreum F0468]|uniref:RCK N-terminal domain-containing protein n=1 Tax=Lachnoanaerobaculum saburreum F0468 TaxID=1095750 RepID=I0R724_9FIRM|nr:hypothetical protein [Lachnoanaerobaculum saburreum]EIC95482.1 hypothetical protein HMPREF9970_0759 [Lachnoanaerobaculum saburreum F0468]